MDWAGWALFGLLATTVLTALMISAQLGGLSRLDLPLILGTVVTPDPDRARAAGFVIHLVVGQAVRPRLRRLFRTPRPRRPGGSVACSARSMAPSP